MDEKLLTALCVVAIALVAVVSFPGAEVAKADNISVANGDFSSYSSDLAPNNWTKSGDTGANIFTGVYDGKVGYDKHGFSNVDLLEHGTASRDFLVINSKDTKAYSAYASSDITVSASSYYQFTVKAKADITVGGAYFSITGLDEEISLPRRRQTERGPRTRFISQPASTLPVRLKSPSLSVKTTPKQKAGYVRRRKRRKPYLSRLRNR